MVRERVRVAFRRSEWWLCHSSHPCDGGAEPPRVVVEFTVRGGSTHDVRVAQVSTYAWLGDALDEQPGDVGGPLARCVASVVERTRFDISELVVRIRYTFSIDVASCGTGMGGSP